MMKMKKPNKAYLDGDILVYKTAFYVEAEGIEDLPDKLNYDIRKWTPKGIDDIVIALSCTRKDNFRRDIWPRYKINREDSYVPEYLSDVYEYIEENYKTKRCEHLEADDILGIYASAGKAIAVTIDKDLRGVRGWHLNPNKEKEPIYISKNDAEKFFCKQWMAGDSTDGVPGLWRIGPKTAEKLLNEWKKKDWHKNILEMYQEDKYIPKDLAGIDEERIGEVMGQCVKILSKRNYNLKTNEINMWCQIVG